jgi:diguanylate cyclase (GGDEF)-like protein
LRGKDYRHSLGTSLRDQGSEDRRLSTFTGLPSGRSFERQFSRLIQDSQESGSTLALVIVDVLHLKEINSRFGWERGDLVLRAVATTLRCLAPPASRLWHLGGDAFVAALPAADAASARAWAQRVQAAATQSSVEVTAGSDMEVGVSFGVSEFPTHGQTANALLRAADRDKQREGSLLAD